MTTIESYSQTSPEKAGPSGDTVDTHKTSPPTAPLSPLPLDDVDPTAVPQNPDSSELSKFLEDRQLLNDAIIYQLLSTFRPQAHTFRIVHPAAVVTDEDIGRVGCSMPRILKDPRPESLIVPMH